MYTDGATRRAILLVVGLVTSCRINCFAGCSYVSFPAIWRCPRDIFKNEKNLHKKHKKQTNKQKQNNNKNEKKKQANELFAFLESTGPLEYILDNNIE